MSLAVQHLNAWYGRTQALHDVNLSFEPLGVTALIGPSGCGKSTFLRCLNRMHEEIPGAHTEGSVLVEGVNICARSIQPMYVRRHIGMVFQQPNPLPTLSIWENVAIGVRLNGLASGKALSERVERSLRQAALWDEVKDRLNTPAVQLSGGQQQRLCIARTLAVEPKIMLMDEPASALDPISTFQVEELIRDLKHTYTVIIVTHNMQQAGRIADRTAFFLQGKLIETGETAQFFARPHEKATEEQGPGFPREPPSFPGKLREVGISPMRVARISSVKLWPVAMSGWWCSKVASLLMPRSRSTKNMRWSRERNERSSHGQ